MIPSALGDVDDELQHGVLRFIRDGQPSTTDNGADKALVCLVVAIPKVDFISYYGCSEERVDGPVVVQDTILLLDVNNGDLHAPIVTDASLVAKRRPAP